MNEDVGTQVPPLVLRQGGGIGDGLQGPEHWASLQGSLGTELLGYPVPSCPR